jgi:prevent-host-death family protein
LLIGANFAGPRTAKNRVHADLVADDRDKESDRLIDLGATRQADHDEHGLSWAVLTDPEGNVLPRPRLGPLNRGGPRARVTGPRRPSPAWPFDRGGTGLDVPTLCRLARDTIGLRELNQNPSRAVARVRAGESIIVTDRGRPVLRLVPETENPSTLHRMISEGSVRPPADSGMPDVLPELADGIASLSDLVIADRDKERHR